MAEEWAYTYPRRAELDMPQHRRKILLAVLTSAGGLGTGDSGFSGSPIFPGYCNLHPVPWQHPPNRDAHIAKMLEGHNKEWNFFFKYLPLQETLKFPLSLVGIPKDATFCLFIGMGWKAGVSLVLGLNLLVCFETPV